MSTNIEWIEQCIKEKHIKYYEYKKFKDIEMIGVGGFGKVYKANWKYDKDFALKSFNLDNSTINEVINELKLHREVDFHDNIIRFHGITKTDSDQHEYFLVLEYADGGTLHHYLSNNFPSLNWQHKYRLAFQLSSAIKCLHEEGIVHRDLHSNNILMCKDSIRLADFGLSKRIEDISKTVTNLFGVVPYIDPKGFNGTRQKKDTISPGGKNSGKSEQYKLNKKSDVYSVGVLFWELSSGKKPFDKEEYSIYLAMDIAKGLRESIIEGTPEEYSNLYTKCWNGDPDERPTIQEVVKTLQSIISPPNSERSREIVASPNLVDTEEGSHQKSDSNPNASLSNLIGVFHRCTITEDIDKLVQTAPTATTNITHSKITDNLIMELVKLFIKATDEGKPREQRRPILNDYLSSHNVTIEEIYEWLKINCMMDPNYIFFIGYLTFSGIGTTKSSINKAFDYFYKASSRNHPTAQYYLGICYENGLGTTNDESSAFMWYERSAKQGQSIVGKFALGICYEKGIGRERNVQTAFNWYREAANSGHAVAQHNLGNFYRSGIYVKRNYYMAFHYYNLSAKGCYAFGISMLGFCYSEGIGTSVDKKMAFELYLKAAKMNNNVAQYNVAVCYYDGIGTTKDFDKSMEWYKKSAENGYDKAIKKLDEHQYERNLSSSSIPHVTFPVPQPYIKYPFNKNH